MSDLYSAHPVMFKNNPLGFVLCILLIPVYGAGVLILLGWYLQNKASKLVVTDNEVLFEQGLLNKDRSELNINSVRTVKVKQTFFNRLLGTGTVELYTAGDTPEIIATGMPEPNKIRELVKNRQNSGR